MRRERFIRPKDRKARKRVDETSQVRLTLCIVHTRAPRSFFFFSFLNPHPPPSSKSPRICRHRIRRDSFLPFLFIPFLYLKRKIRENGCCIEYVSAILLEEVKSILRLKMTSENYSRTFRQFFITIGWL